MKLGKLKSVELREYWKHEALDFTKWLAEPDNLRELGDTVGIDIDVQQVETEVGVGSFSADIVTQEENSGRKIVIENQLETTNHSHLGQILTYAAGQEAELIFWVVKEAREEHRQAVDWLNEHTSDKINIFLAKIELWQIGDSNPAPKFVIISRPNDWTKTVRNASSSQRELSDTRLQQLDFWTKLREFASAAKPSVKLRAPQAQHWFDAAIGRSDCHASFTILISDNQVGCEIYIPKSKELYKKYYANKDRIEEEIDLVGKLEWMELPTKKASRIRTHIDFDFSKTDKTPVFEWLLETYHKMKKAFVKDW